MSRPAESVTPAWMPSSVGAAYRRGSATGDDLLSGRAWDGLLASLERVGAVLRSDRVPQAAVDQAAGYHHLLVLLGLGVDEALRPSDPYDPHIGPANVDAVFKWGMDCPDAAYSGAAIRGDATYRVSGHRGTARYVGFQVMGGMESTANVVIDDLEVGDDGRFELMLSPHEQPGNWMPLAGGATSLVIRQFFYDWENEEPARLTIECLEGARSTTAAHPPAADGVARQLLALGEYMETSIGFWLDIEEAGRAQGLNIFRPPVNKTEMGAAAESVTVWGSWELDDDQALLIEVTPPAALYWSVALGDFWWETIDYANHQSSLNGHQAVIDPDGAFRAVVSHADPAVANWLDTAGRHCGPVIFRWVRAEGAPVPQTRLVDFDELERVLPAGTRRVDAATRRQTISRRAAAVRRRFAR